MYRPNLHLVILAMLVSNIMALSISLEADNYTPISERTAQEVITKLGLIPNPEKGYYIQTFIDPTTTAPANNRSVSTAIFYLLEGASGPSNWHRIDAVEIWHYYAGAPLILSLSTDDGTPMRKMVLGPDVFDEQCPQVIVQKEEWQRARSLGRWTLVGTTVAPGFVESGFELGAPGWEPTGA